MSQPCAGNCGRPADTMLCPGCTGAVTDDLRALVDGGPARAGRHRGLLAELDITVARQHVLGDPVGVRSRAADAPLPYHAAAADLRWTVGNTVTTWARDIVERGAHDPSWTSVADAAAWLAVRPTVLASHPAAGELYDEITHVVGQIRTMIDRDRDRQYLGPCDECGDDLYALPERDHVQCPACGTGYDTSKRRAWLLDAVDDRLATAAEISRALPTLVRRPITAAMVRGYARRGRLVARSADPRGAPRYRIGDVITLVMRDPACT